MKMQFQDNKFFLGSSRTGRYLPLWSDLRLYGSLWWYLL